MDRADLIERDPSSAKDAFWFVWLLKLGFVHSLFKNGDYEITKGFPVSG